MTDNKSVPQPKKKIKLYVGVAVLIAVVTYLQMNVWSDIPEIAGPAIIYDHLSSEGTEPFIIMSSGIRPIEHGKNSKLEKRYAPATRKFKDVRDCLIPSEAKKSIPDLRLINWHKMKSKAYIEVCMYRIFASLGTPEKAKLWFEAQSLKTAKISNRIASKKINGKIVIVNGGHVDDEQITVSAVNYPKKSGRIYVSTKTGFVMSLSRYLIYAEGFGVTWSNGEMSIGTAYSAATT